MRCDWNCPCPGYKEGVAERNLWREVREVKEGEGLKDVEIEEFCFELLWRLEIVYGLDVGMGWTIHVPTPVLWLE